MQVLVVVFFFQAEDGIRDSSVTGVQTCALPILLFPAIVGFCCIGTYTINSNAFDVFVMGFFALFGYLCLKLECEPAPLILGFLLGPLMEENLRRALLISPADPIVFVQEPIPLAF